ncbi:MAG: hypothetical protein ACLTSZ_13175 [Lachnospiraceae bacterium]
MRRFSGSYRGNRLRPDLYAGCRCSSINGKELAGKTVVVSGSGNVAIYAVEKAQQLGAKVVAMSDSNGYVYDPEGIKLDVVKEIKEVRRGRIKEYAAAVPSCCSIQRARASGPFQCDIALPCATQNELNLDDAKTSEGKRLLAVSQRAQICRPPERQRISSLEQRYALSCLARQQTQAA